MFGLQEWERWFTVAQLRNGLKGKPSSDKLVTWEEGECIQNDDEVLGNVISSLKLTFGISNVKVQLEAFSTNNIDSSSLRGLKWEGVHWPISESLEMGIYIEGRIEWGSRAAHCIPTFYLTCDFQLALWDKVASFNKSVIAGTFNIIVSAKNRDVRPLAFSSLVMHFLSMITFHLHIWSSPVLFLTSAIIFYSSIWLPPPFISTFPHVTIISPILPLLNIFSHASLTHDYCRLLCIIVT
jgi:hypothetical protein